MTVVTTVRVVLLLLVLLLVDWWIGGSLCVVDVWLGDISFK